MPAFGDGSEGTHDAATWKLVVFIRHLPRLSVEEEQKMEELNPNTEDERQQEQQEQEYLRGGNPQIEDRTVNGKNVRVDSVVARS
jgi:hypothetical protein